MSLYGYRTFTPPASGHARHDERQVYLGPPLKAQGQMAAVQLPPELDRLVVRDLPPPAVDAAAIRAVRRVITRLEEPRGGGGTDRRRADTLSGRIRALLAERAVPMICEEIAAALEASVSGVRGIAPKLAHVGDCQVRHIQRPTSVGGNCWARRSAQYLAPGLSWPPPPAGWRLYVRGGGQ